MKIKINRLLPVLAMAGLSACSKTPVCKVPVVYDFDLAVKPTAEETAVCLQPNSLKIPKARIETEPRLASPWQPCDGPLAGRSEETIYQCADQAFWQGFSDGRADARQQADRRLSEALPLLENWDDQKRLARMHFLRGALRLAMALENGKLKYAIFNKTYVEPDMVRASELDPEGIAGPAFLQALDIANAANFKRWNQATALASNAVNGAYHTGIGTAFALGGTVIGFPMNTGMPQATVKMMEDVPCDVYFCTENTQKAPYALAGLAFQQAEGYARVGDKAHMLEWLNQSRSAPNYEDWYFKYIVDGIEADPDAFLQKFAQYGDKGSPFMEVYANSNFGCVFCHGRL